MNNNNAPGTATFLGHPRGLATLFFTEFFERFSYYGMRALLVLFLTATVANGGFGVDEKTAGAVYGLYAGSVYLFSLPGGWIADRLIGARRSIFYGGILIALGNFMLGVPATPAVFYAGLLVIALGTGLLKPNVSAVVGDLYVGQSGARRDAAFSIFYMGINLGATVAPMVCGTLGEVYGWHYGFVTAGIGMLAGLTIYVGGRRHLPRDVARDFPAAVRQPARRGADIKAIAALCLVACVITFFWAAYEQQGNAIVLWVRDFTDRSFFGLFELRTTWFLSLNPLFIFVLTPLLVASWTWAAARGGGMSPGTKMALGCLFACAAYGVLVLAVALAGGTRVSWAWMVLFFILLTLAELHVSPVALSLFSRAAPAWAASMMMGVWFMSGVAGNYLAGVMGSFWERLPKGTFWALAGAVPLFAGLIMLGLRGLLDRIILQQQALDTPR